MGLTKAIQSAIKADGRSLYQIATAGNVGGGILSRFMRGERTLTLETAERVLAALNVDCTLVRRRKGR